MNIFNLFITYGDTFLPSPGSYDELYYELIRMQHVFEDLYSMGKTLFFKSISFTKIDVIHILLTDNNFCSLKVLKFRQ